MNSSANRAWSSPLALMALMHAAGCGGEQITEAAPLPSSIVLSQPSLSFSMTEGTPNAPSASIGISNGGGEALAGLSSHVEYGPDGPAGWLTASLDANSAPTNLNVGADASALGPGSYEAEVLVDAPGADNSPQIVTVSVEVDVDPDSPMMALSTTELTIPVVEGGSAPTPRKVEITNAGGGTLDGIGLGVSYPDGAPAGWLSPSIVWTTAPAEMQMTVRMDALPPPGTYHGTVLVHSSSAGNSPRSIAVTLEVAPPGPYIRLQALEASFVAAEGSETVTRSGIYGWNGGPGTLEGLAASVRYGTDQPTGWLETEIRPAGKGFTLMMTVLRGSLDVGTYTAEVDVTADDAANSPATVRVTFEVVPEGPTISLSPQFATFDAPTGASPITRTIEVTNVGSGTLSGLALEIDYHPHDEPGWLAASLDATTAPTTLTLSADPGSLPSGSYRAYVEVSSPLANTGPKTIFAIMTLTEGSDDPGG